jgi:hypothetical protein
MLNFDKKKELRLSWSIDTNQTASISTYMEKNHEGTLSSIRGLRKEKPV